MKLYVATSNPGKLRDFATAAGAAIPVEPLPGLAEIPAPPEDEPTFEGNARAKALFYSRYAPLCIVLADDSGLEVDALDGAPGVRSARYAEDCDFAGVGMSLDERNNACLLAALANVPRGTRSGQYRCVLAAALDGEVIAVAEGEIAGEILADPAGSGGFGYDPLFYLPDQGATMAEIAPEVRLSISHRGRALRALLPLLPNH